jgi:hypothetical protein
VKEYVMHLDYDPYDKTSEENECFVKERERDLIVHCKNSTMAAMCVSVWVMMMKKWKLALEKGEKDSVSLVYYFGSEIMFLPGFCISNLIIYKWYGIGAMQGRQPTSNPILLHLFFPVLDPITSNVEQLLHTLEALSSHT